jgi:prepilin-type N-terminal cleavage/methylation domain-containing protein
MPNGAPKLQPLGYSAGFTLAELLIVLTILGTIATYTIPKVLISQQNSQRNAVLKETIATLDSTLYNLTLTDTVTDNTDLLPVVQSKINYVKLCPSNTPIADGCWDAAMGNPGLQNNNYVSFTLANGAYVLGLGNGTNSTLLTGKYTQYAIDWNGPAGPNLEGSDQIYLQYCYDEAACPAAGTGYTGRKSLVSHPRGNNSVSLFATLFAS